MGNYFDKFDTPSEGGNFFDQFDETAPVVSIPEKSAHTTVGDVAKSLASGALNAVGETFHGAGSLIAKGVNVAGETIGLNPDLRAVDPLQSIESAIEESKSAAGKLAEQSFKISGDTLDPTTWKVEGLTPGGALQFAAQTFGQYVPQVLLALVTGGTSTTAQAVAGATVGGMQGYGGGATQERNFVMNASPDELSQKSVFYKNLIDQGVPPDAAREATAKKAELGGGLGNGIPSALEGAVEQLILKSKIPIGFGNGVTKTISGTALGAVGQGVEEDVEQRTQNLGSNIAIGGNRPIGEDTLVNAIGGFVGGAGFGAATSMAPSQRHTAPITDQEIITGVTQAKTVDDAITAATSAAATQDSSPLLALPAPRVIVTPEGNAGTESQLAQSQAAAAEQDQQLGITPDIRRQIINANPAPTSGVVTAPAEPVSETTTQEPSVKDIHALADSKNIQWNNDPTFLKFTETVTGKQHIDDLTVPERKVLFDRISEIPGLPQAQESIQQKAAPIETASTQTISDRRIDIGQRKRVSELTPDELRSELLTSSLTGLGNKRAHEEAVKKPVQMSLDLDSLKYINDSLGHDAGDKVLKEFGRILGEVTNEAYHISGDEFVAQANDIGNADTIGKLLEQKSKQIELTFQSPDGKKYTLRGIGFSYGTGNTLQQAERGLQSHKLEREQNALRARRGEQPANLSENVAQGQQVNQRQAQEVAPPVAHRVPETAPVIKTPPSGATASVARNVEVPHETKTPKILTFEQFAAQNGASKQDFGDAGLHRKVGTNDTAWARLVKNQADKDAKLQSRRNDLRTQYDQHVSDGSISNPSREDRLQKTSQGHPDNPSTQAALRLLAKKTKPLSDITVKVEAIEAETGKKMSIQDQADSALKNVDERISKLQALKKCLAL